jgi:hypothetical protein
MNATATRKRRTVPTMMLLALLGLGGGGCAYGGIASTPDGTVLVARNSLFGARARSTCAGSSARSSSASRARTLLEAQACHA